MERKKLVVIGGGAAGIFGAISAAEHFPDAEVVVLEKSDKLLSKVKISGGGRCNVTHACYENANLVKSYPRGNKALRPVFNLFTTVDTIRWFEGKGVKLKVESDGRMFPVTDNSQTIIDCLMGEVARMHIEVKKKYGVQKIEHLPSGRFRLWSDRESSMDADAVLIATGGSPKHVAYQWIEVLGHTIVPPVPSLFTFNVPDSWLNDLAGISLSQALVKIAGTKLEYTGPLLITHWGFSGPAVLKLSAWGARWLQEQNYACTIHIRWIAEHQEDKLRVELQKFKEAHPKKVISGNPLFGIPQRLWKRLVEMAEISEDLRWVDISKKGINKLVENLFRAEFKVNGKTTFKEEFVTCGGVSLSEINMSTMESKLCKGLFFAGEVLDIDGITGGFNFQNAWTTGYIAGKEMGRV
jgi:predicted Rossmann fold flavoprotein